MKTLIFLLALAAGSAIAFHYFQKPELIEKKTVNLGKPFCVVYLQDASKSISENGVELIHSEIFAPYYNDTNRDIDLNFGIISGLSAKKFITLKLYGMTFIKPEMPDLSSVSKSKERKIRQQYTHALQQYRADSADFFQKRNVSIERFKKEVDEAIAQYKNALSQETDLVSAIKIADKVFNYSKTNSALNFLLLNSDGLDSQNRRIEKLQNDAEVILISANGIDTENTSVDCIITQSFQSSEEAIQFTLINSKN